MKSSRSFVVGGLFAALFLLVAAFFIQNLNLKYEIARPEEANDAAFLERFQQHRLYKQFTNRYPNAILTSESGIVRLSEPVERDGTQFVYALEFSPETGPRLFESEIVFGERTVYGEQRMIVMEDLFGLQRETEQEAQGDGERRSAP